MMKVSAEVFRLQVLVNGRAVQEYRGPGSNTFIEGKQGSDFELELTNLTPRRILVHPTVDGLSAMTGKEASRDDSSQGYVLSPYQSMRVPGWRLDNDSVAKFYFAGNGGSYAEKTGRGADKGVIACTVWEEVVQTTWYAVDPVLPPWPPRCPPIRHSFGGGRFSSCGAHSRSCFSNDEVTSGTITASNCSGVNVACAATSEATAVYAAQTQNLGTGFGKQATHQVLMTSFVAQDQPTCVAVIYYDDLQGLKNRGIKISCKRDQKLPNPFPKDATGCTPPSDWQR